MCRSIYRNEAFWTVVTQIIISLLLSIFAWIICNPYIAGSFALGGVVCVLPNIYLYRRVFAFNGASQAKHIVKAFYWGEAIKFLLIGAGFFCALFLPGVRPQALFIGFVVTQMTFWLAPVYLGLARIKSKK